MDFVHRHQALVELRRFGRLALVIVNDKFDGQLLVVRLHIDSALGVYQLGPALAQTIKSPGHGRKAPTQWQRSTNKDVARRLSSAPNAAPQQEQASHDERHTSRQECPAYSTGISHTSAPFANDFSRRRLV